MHAGEAGGPPAGGWSLAGVVAEVSAGPGPIRAIVELPGPADDVDLACLLVFPDTTISVIGEDGTSAAGTPADIVPGARIEARHAGAELCSLPPQVRATSVRVLAGP